ncbi:uncharacterized protein LOC113359354 [Papaver somniferum]|uniref:uncharacterized protein LOC113359354 n=1 Tax=Papaver somniferum TaxID=3469 RepID=UPI000E701213|nr:uncharacterized protein LOC113359354 [Papaver somniferum]
MCDALNERDKGKLPSQPQQVQKSAFQVSTSTCNEFSRDHVNFVTTLRSGEVVDNNVGVPQSVESKSDSPVHTTPQKTPVVEKESEHDSDSKNSTDINVPAPSHVPVAPFPQRLVQQKKGTQYNEIGSFMCISVPFSLNRSWGDETHSVTLQLADRSAKIPRGIVEDVLIKVENFYFPVDFIVLDTQPVQYHDDHIPVILGRPFLATSNAIINCRNGVLNLSFGNMTVELNVFNISQQPMDCDDSDLHEINMIESLIQDSLPDILSVDPLQACLDNFDLDLLDSKYISEVHSLLESVPPMDIAKWQNAVESHPLSDSESAPIPDESPKLDLKPLPDTLKYAFLDPSETFPVIIASCLDTEQESQLLEVLKKHKEALGWTISDLKDSQWVSPIQVVPKKSGITVVQNEMNDLLTKDVAFVFDDACKKAWEQLKALLTYSLIVRPPDWTLPFEIMCDASDYAVGAVLGRRVDKLPYVIYYASKTLNDAQLTYSNTEKELLDVVFALDKFISYLIGSKVIIYSDHAALKYLLSKKDAKARLIRWAGTQRKLQLNELEELQNDAYDSAKMYKHRMKVFHDKRILRKSFTPGQNVLFYTTRLHLFPKLENPTTNNIFKVNGQRLKPFLEPLPPDETTDLEDHVYVD